MRTLVIGDLHGCLIPLQRLLEQFDFDEHRDRLWFTGDLINRGPMSLHTLRFVKRLDACSTVVLGNHDLHLLATAAGLRKPSSKDTLDEILKAPDRDELLHWLRHRPLAHHDPQQQALLVHAGVHPTWTVDDTLHAAASVEAVLQSDEHERFLGKMYGDEPRNEKKAESRTQRRRFAVNVLTRMRACTERGDLDFDFKALPDAMPKKLYPWYDVPERTRLPCRILFGHWSAHPAGPVTTLAGDVVALDGGVIWGGSLVGYELESGEIWQVQG